MSTAVAELLNSGRVWRGHEHAHIEAEPTAHGALDAALPGKGWPVGGLCEIVHARHGLGELSLVLPLLARLTQAQRPVALLAPPHIPYAPALLNAGIVLTHFLVVDAPEPDLFWSAEQLLRARTAAVLIWTQRVETQALRRLQLAAEDMRGFVFLFHNGNLRSFSPAALRLRVQEIAGKTPQIEILKCRGGAIGQSFALG